MAHTTRGLEEVLEDVVRDLRTTPTVTDHLESPEAITQGHPSTTTGYPASIVITPIYGGSTPHRGAVTRTIRVQVTVTTTASWRDARAAEDGTTALSSQYAILDAVADRLDFAEGTEEAPLGAEGGVSPPPTPDDGGRLSITDDWRLRGTYESG